MTRIVYRYLALTISLLILYAILNLLTALQFLPSNDALGWLSFPQISLFAASLLDLAIVGGLLGGGIYVTITPNSPRNQPGFRLALRLWSLLVFLTITAGILNLPPALGMILPLIKVIVIALVIINIRRTLPKWTPFVLVWAVGMALSAICALVNLIPTSDFLLSAVIHALTAGVNIYIGQVLAAVALIYWLIGRFSTVTAFWAETSLYTVAGLLSLAGALLTLSMLQPLRLNLGWLRTFIAIGVPLLTLIFASHTYLAFSNRNTTNTLAAHWAVLGVLLLLGGGILGGLQATVQLWTAGTHLNDLQPMLAQFAVVSVLLGVINQIVFEIRGQPRRVTGLAPFWLVAFGMIGGGLALAGAGLVQVYLERVIGVDFLETQALIAPLYGLWVLGLALMTLGLLLYGLIHWLRRPRFDD